MAEAEAETEGSLQGKRGVADGNGRCRVGRLRGVRVARGVGRLQQLRAGEGHIGEWGVGNERGVGHLQGNGRRDGGGDVRRDEGRWAPGGNGHSHGEEGGKDDLKKRSLKFWAIEKPFLVLTRAFILSGFCGGGEF